MSDQVTLELVKRETVGKGVKRLRREGQVPAVIHDHGKESVHVQAEYQTVLKAYRRAGKHAPVQLTADGKKYTALIKNVTFDPRQGSITHVVFNAIKANEKVAADIPVKPLYPEGDEASPAEKAGLIVLSQLETVTVKALPRDLPKVLNYKADKLVEIGDHVTVADLMVPEGVEVETDADHSLATVFEPSALAAANEAAAGDSEEAAPAEDGSGVEGGEAEAKEETGSESDESK